MKEEDVEIGGEYCWLDIKRASSPILRIIVERTTEKRAYGTTTGYRNYALISDLMTKEEAILDARLLRITIVEEKKRAIEKWGDEISIAISKFESKWQEGEE